MPERIGFSSSRIFEFDELTILNRLCRKKQVINYLLAKENLKLFDYKTVHRQMQYTTNRMDVLDVQNLQTDFVKLYLMERNFDNWILCESSRYNQIMSKRIKNKLYHHLLRQLTLTELFFWHILFHAHELCDISCNIVSLLENNFMPRYFIKCWNTNNQKIKVSLSIFKMLVSGTHILFLPFNFSYFNSGTLTWSTSIGKGISKYKKTATS